MKRTKRITALLLAALLAVSVFPAAVNAAAIKMEPMVEETVYGFMPTPHIGSHALTDAYLRGKGDSINSDRAAETTAALPSRYDSRDYGYVTSVKNQNPYGTCWAFATTAPIETYMIKHGITNPDTGAPSTTSLNLSEYHLSWFSFTPSYDYEGFLVGDSTSPTGNNTFLTSGGNGLIATYTLMNWRGPASEATSALAYNRTNTNGLDPMYAYSFNTVHVEDALWIPGSNIDAIKRAIMEYGAGTINYYHNIDYMNNNTSAMCFKQTAEPFSSDYIEPNHAVTLVGWDDNYSKSNFNAAYGPSHDGAWIVKNSWGASVFQQGYFYLSYEDSSALNDYCYFFKVAGTDNYQHNYQYDGTSNFVTCLEAGSGTQIANVFTSNGSELLRAVSLNVWDEGVSYTLDIYKNPSNVREPTSGTKVATQTGSFPSLGYFTVPLNTPVALNSGDRFAVVFTLNAPSASESGLLSIPFDSTYAISWIKWVHADHGDTSFYKTPGNAWTDCPSNGDFRIKAYTDDYVPTVSYTVSAESNNNAYGTVSVVGNTIVASPAPGYVVSGCEVVAGSATYTIDGNTIQVSPASDCTLRVIFASVPTYTVNLMACGVKVESRSVLQNGTTVLPASVSETPDDWTFCGWVSSPVEETSSEPTYYAPGATYTVTGNTTLYALFTRTEGNSELGFRLLTATPDTWEGNYVITYTANASSMHVLKGAVINAAPNDVTSMSSPTYAPMLSGTGITLNQDMLTNVSSVYQFHIFPYGSNYRIQNLGTGSYIGGTTTLYAITERHTNFLSWTLAMSNGAAQMKNTYKGNYLNYNTAGYFNESSSVNSTIRLWKEAPIGTTYYSTEFAPANHVHSVQYVPAVAPTCTEAGQKAYYYCDSESCALFGQKFADEALTVELTNLSVPALGHNPGAAVEENRTEPTATTEGGYDTVVYCTRCQTELSREHTVLPATGVHTHTLSYVSAVAPTCGEAGREACYVCTGCGKYFSDSAANHEITLDEIAVPATGNHTYGEWISTRHGTHYHVCSVCGESEVVPCTYVDVVTPPTTTDQGYTTHTCTVCGFRYVDTYVAPVTPDYVVTFSVPNSVTPVASMTCTPGTSIVLPTASAPDGYTFLGWVHTSVSPTAATPGNIMTGAYEPTGNTTLYALYSYVNTESGFQLVTSALENWEGTYVITYNTNGTSMRVLKGAMSSSVVGMSNATYAPTLASTGITRNQDMLTNVNSVYQFSVTAHGSYYWIQNIGTTSYIGGTTTLYAITKNYTSYLSWTFSFQNGVPLLRNVYKGNYLSFNTKSGGYFCLSSNTNANISLWKQVSTSGTYYTTIFN